MNGKRIKIFNVATKELVKIYRRGFSIKGVELLVFSQDCQSLCLGTEGTIHVWNTELNNSAEEAKQQPQKKGFMHKIMSKIGGAELSYAKWKIRNPFSKIIEYSPVDN